MAITSSALALAIETFFSARRYEGLPLPRPVHILFGSLPVLVSAPHAVRHPRNGRLKLHEKFTGSLAMLMHHLTGCSAIFAVRTDSSDPNLDPVSPYKDELARLITAQPVAMVLDLHGMKDFYAMDIDLGTMNDTSLLGRGDLVGIFKTTLEKHGIGRVEVNKRFRGDLSVSITRYASQTLGVPAIQVEIARRWRDPRQDPNKFNTLVAALAEYIQTLGEVV